MLRQHDGVQHEPAIVADLIAMPVRHLVKDAVSAEQPELAAHERGTSTTFRFGCRRADKEQGLQVAIPQSTAGEFAAVDSLQQGRERA